MYKLETKVDELTDKLASELDSLTKYEVTGKPIESIELQAKLLLELIEDTEFTMKWSVKKKLDEIIDECERK
ncbi:hypothetical protein ACSHUI_00515 [Bacillus subtilis]|uniref:hypothetical protein n=1 Tax=Bacillus subtilis TaxID=1423 RepID=UPI0027A33CA0|nr:hypothetical protein Goe26_00280 [Bacillus phage vB_BsuM-Goe26]